VKSLFYLLFLVLVGVSHSSTAAAPVWETVDAVAWADRLVVLKGDGVLVMWQAGDKGFEFVPGDEAPLKEINHVAVSNSRLWAATSTGVFRREARDKRWTEVTTLPKSKDTLLALAVVGETPLLVYPTHVYDPLKKKDFSVPESKIAPGVLALKACYATSTMVWLGTGRGEWGGTLYGLDPENGAWVHYSDSLHYVTGITSVARDRPLVSWSMSHFMATAMIRTHDIGAQPSSEWNEVKRRYYQRVAYSAFDHALYVIENESLARITRMASAEIVRLPGQVFAPEPNAIGVAPGVRAVVPMGPHSIIVAPNIGAPMQVDTAKKTLRTLPVR
jgi:hypothetical protein